MHTVRITDPARLRISTHPVVFLMPVWDLSNGSSSFHTATFPQRFSHFNPHCVCSLGLYPSHFLSISISLRFHLTDIPSFIMKELNRGLEKPTASNWNSHRLPCIETHEAHPRVICMFKPSYTQNWDCRLSCNSRTQKILAFLIWLQANLLRLTVSRHLRHVAIQHSLGKDITLTVAKQGFRHRQADWLLEPLRLLNWLCVNTA